MLLNMLFYIYWSNLVDCITYDTAQEPVSADHVNAMTLHTRIYRRGRMEQTGIIYGKYTRAAFMLLHSLTRISSSAEYLVSLFN